MIAPRRPLLALLLVASTLACASFSRRHPLDSAEILDRLNPNASADVKHILIGWKWLGVTYRKMGMTLDSRAEDRTETVAEELAKSLLVRLRAGEPIEPMMKEFSEDEGSAKTGIAYPVTPEGRYVPEFKDLALRLNVGESGIVRTQFGFHIMKRTR